MSYVGQSHSTNASPRVSKASSSVLTVARQDFSVVVVVVEVRLDGTVGDAQFETQSGDVGWAVQSLRHLHQLQWFQPSVYLQGPNWCENNNKYA